MPMWRDSHTPDSYVSNFHRPFREGPGKWLVMYSEDEKDVRREGRRFNAFRATLRRWPNHPTSREMMKYDARLSYELGHDGVWMLYCTVSYSSDLALKVIEKIL